MSSLLCGEQEIGCASQLLVVIMNIITHARELKPAFQSKRKINITKQVSSFCPEF